MLSLTILCASMSCYLCDGYKSEIVYANIYVNALLFTIMLMMELLYAYHAYVLQYYHVWKIFIWNYFFVENVRENNFCGLPMPMKIF